MIKDILKRPVVTEKSRANVQENVFTFAVHPEATKTDVRHAVESLYRVTVLDVRMIRTAHRARHFMGRAGHERQEKKALVKLKAGDTIQAFQV
ncbi:50S ribosomal protein L23 [Candidatus Jorgensenbacteria bacterium GWA1_54_12]|uniref:Large ribosomal subunit protein uL23 n=1 Tax=Candidatus Jorgensenbacteria bacterium GWA1_54_12 TaxID=1798468 RepID=A0A1F6BL67_9BACT|nr:MAG: 50S ribosomal protein L23 [Candidatus Jorgensenbacteria bacterium GWA1_54_12]